MNDNESSNVNVYTMRRLRLLLNLPVVVVGSVKGVVGTSVVVGASVVVAASLTHSIVHSAPMSFFFLLLLNLTVMSPA